MGHRENRDAHLPAIDAVGSWEEQVALFAIVKLDDDGIVRGWNAGAAALKGYAADEILGRHFSAFYREADRDRDLPCTLLGSARREGSTEDTGWRVRRDGSEFWAHVTITAIRDADGRPAGFVKIVRDLTRQKQVEDEQATLQRTFAHDLISPVTALRGFLEMLELEIGEGNPTLERALAASEHLTAMASALMADAVSHTPGGHRAIDVALVVKSAASLVLRADAGGRIVFGRMDEVVIHGDVLALRRAIANVIENAAKYSDARIDVAVTASESAVVIAVSDRGRGIHPDDIESLTLEGERGRLADGADGGSGLGLASVSRIVSDHRGTVAIASTLGLGTTVTLTLPR